MRHEDNVLAHDVMRHGGVVYRTHGYGVVVVRHGGGQTSPAPDRVYEEIATEAHSGWRPEHAGMMDVPRPRHAGPA